jgi:hypothetical protein
MSEEQLEPTAAELAPPPAARSQESTSLNLTGGVLETMMEKAARFPRDLKRVQAAAFAELEIVPELAARSYYSIPYNVGRKNETRVEGPSIKAAMTLCRNWGNAFNDGRVTDEDKSNIYVQGIFFDIESNLVTIRPIKVSKFYKPAGGQGVVPRNADLLYNAVQAGISKAIRNAILASLPDWLVSGYFQRAKELVVNPPKRGSAPVISLEDRILKGKQLICREFKVTPEEMETYLTENADCYEDNGSLLIHLQGLFNSLRDGQSNVAEVFRPNQKAEEMPGMPQPKL